jgi:hypothetical protein
VKRIVLVCLAVGAVGIPCARATAQGPGATGDLPPAGYGTLNQDQLSIRLQDGDIEVRLLPLEERLLRLVARDGYESLHGLVASRRAQIDSAAQTAGIANPGLALVTFFGLRDDARYDPQNVSLFYRNQFYRPTAIIPISSNFSSRQLPVRRQASAIFVFEMPLPIYEEFEVAYGSSVSTGWKDILPRLDRERGRALARWQAVRGDTTAPPPKAPSPPR